MSRGMHRHRKIRLQRLAEHKISTRRAKAPGKASARTRRDQRIIAKIKTTKAGVGYAGEIQSWLAYRLEKPFAKITSEDIALAIA